MFFFYVYKLIKCERIFMPEALIFWIMSWKTIEIVTLIEFVIGH